VTTAEQVQVGPFGASVAAAPPGPLGALDGEAFLRLMIAQLQNQNPFAPMDANEMLQQTAALSTVESLQQLAQSERLLMGLAQASMAASLVGKHVTGLDAAGEQVAGVVTKVRFTIDGPILEVGDREIPIGNLLDMTASGVEGSTP
jgi:flagellar basal-body rod modification protein FlgD